LKFHLNFLVWNLQAEAAQVKELEEQLKKMKKDREDLLKQIAHERAKSKRQYVAENGLRFLRMMAHVAVGQGIHDVAIPINMGNLAEFGVQVTPGKMI
jgi:hypothetical protein